MSVVPVPLAVPGPLRTLLHLPTPAVSTSATGPSPDPAPPKGRLRRRAGVAWRGLRLLLVCVLACAAVVVLAHPLTNRLSDAGLGALCGLPVSVCVGAQRGAARRLGRFTGAAAVCLLTGAAAAAWTLLVPDCPGRVGPAGRCTPGEVSSWTMVGVLTPALVLILTGLAVLAWRVLRRTGRVSVRLTLGAVGALCGRGRAEPADAPMAAGARSTGTGTGRTPVAARTRSRSSRPRRR